MALDLLSIGDVSIDEFMKISDASVVCDLDQKNCKICFDYADKIPVEAFEATIAGNSSNNVIASTKLDMVSCIYTELGDDYNAKKFISTYKKMGINTDYCIQNSKSPTNVHTIIVFKGERTILSYHEPRQYKIQNWETPKWIYYSSIPANFENFQANLVKYMQAHENVGLAFNPGTFHLRAGLSKLLDILSVTDILFVNKEEAEKLSQGKSLAELHSNLQKLGPKLTVITEGDKGSSTFENEKLYTLGVYIENSDVVDKTGAGDAHSSAFLAASFHGKTIDTALKWGAINASGVVRKIGSIAGLRTRKEIEEIVGKDAKFTTFNPQ